MSSSSGSAPAGPKKESPAVRSLKDEKRHQEDCDKLDEGLEETFPASDPPAVTNVIRRPGAPKENK